MSSLLILFFRGVEEVSNVGKCNLYLQAKFILHCTHSHETLILWTPLRPDIPYQISSKIGQNIGRVGVENSLSSYEKCNWNWADIHLLFKFCSGHLTELLENPKNGLVAGKISQKSSQIDKRAGEIGVSTKGDLYSL